MKAQDERPSSEEMAQFRKDLSRKIERLAAESLEAWSTCENPACRRARACASEKRECLAKWQASQPPLSPEEAEARMQDFRLSLAVRKRLGDGVTQQQLADAIRDERARREAALLPQQPAATPPVAEPPNLTPEKQARMDRAWNEYVTEQEKPKRERRPRITRL
jgi:hypothetical protein